MFTGGLGLAASGNIGDHTAVFEPVHGSAPDITGMGKANPFAAILAAAMMLDHIGERENADRVNSAVTTCIADGAATQDLGGNLTSQQVTDEVIKRL